MRDNLLKLKKKKQQKEGKSINDDYYDNYTIPATKTLETRKINIENKYLINILRNIV
jgi:hypothetical protein